MGYLNSRLAFQFHILGVGVVVVVVGSSASPWQEETEGVEEEPGKLHKQQKEGIH